MKKLKISGFAIAAGLLGFLVFGGTAAASTAAALSNTVEWRLADSICYYHYAATENTTSGPPRFGSGTLYLRQSFPCSDGVPASASVGQAAFLIKTNGAACVTAAASYYYGSGGTRHAYYNASACGTGVQLRGSTTSYAYTGTSYTSASITAPYLTF